MQTVEPGLRERKRAETRSRLETAALDFALRDGVERTTIEAVCKAANVSTRTFFNYFDSKEDAILGLTDIEITEQMVAEALAGHDRTDPVGLTMRLLFGILQPSVATAQLQESRKRLLTEHPHLLGRVALQFLRMSAKLTVAIQPALLRLPQFRDEGPEDSAISAELLVALCGGAARIALKEWTGSGNSTPIEAVEHRALELVNTTVKRMR